MVKKTLLSLAISATVLGLSGCNISSTGDNKQDQTGVNVGTPGVEPSVVAPLINPVRGTSFPALASDLLYGFPKDATTGAPIVTADADGTIYHAGAYKTDADGKRTAELIEIGGEGYNPVLNALNEMDGVSTTAAMDILMTGTVDVDSIKAGVNFFIIPLVYKDGSDNILDPLKAGAAVPAPDVANAIAADDLQFEMVTYANNKQKALRISFKKPLASATRYVLIMTDGMKSSSGSAIAQHKEYTALISDSAVYISDAAQAAVGGLRGALKGWDALAKGTLAAISSAHAPVMSYTFTTGGTTEVLGVMASAGNAVPALKGALADQEPKARTVVIPNNVVLGDTNALLGATDTSGAKFMSGTIQLPYYLKAPVGAYAGENPAAGYACDLSTAPDPAACGAVKQSAGYTITSQWEADGDAIFDLTGDATKKAPSTNVTRLFPFAKLNGMDEVPLLIVKPAAAAPAAGYPVVIFQHGITSNRMSALPLATQLAQAGYVTISMDLPLHGVMPTDVLPSDGMTPALAAFVQQQGGTPNAATIGAAVLNERHFGLTRNGLKFEPTAVESTADAEAGYDNKSGSLFINLAHFQTSRDNMRQAVMDLMNLNASLPAVATASGLAFDYSKIKFVGHSLGAIIGTTFVGINNGNVVTAKGGQNDNGNANLFALSGAVFGMPGSAVPRLLEESKAFGPSIVGALTAPKSAGGFGLTQDGSSFAQLMYILQGTVDSADPLSVATGLAAAPFPFTVIESVGDKVVPNNASRSVLAGTDPLARLMGTTQVDTTTDLSTLTLPHYLIRYNDADSTHSSIASPVRPDDSDPTVMVADVSFASIATHIVSLFNGTPAVVNDAVIEAAASN